jgi:4-hydroxyphenylacetate 3-monooxygenase
MDAGRYLASLRDGRSVFYDGQRVADVTAHPAFRRTVRSMARLYDFQADPKNLELMTYGVEGGGRANRIWQLPASYDEFVTRRKALEAWAELHCGFLGRTPDHIASCIAGMYMGLAVFEAHDAKRAAALADYYRYARDNSVFLTSALINPQVDRTKSTNQQKTEFTTAGIVDRSAAGITVRGAKMLATAGVMAHEVLVASIQPLRPGDEQYALSFVSPMNASGLKILSRKSYEMESGAVFDNPLSSRFDENDAILFFDDVKVPWDRVFVAGDLAMTQKQFHATPAHVHQNHQSMIRLTVKLRFLLGIARRIAEMNGIVELPQVREILGQLAAEAALVEALVLAMEVKGGLQGGYFVPDSHLLYTAQVLTQQLYPRFTLALRELAGGGMIALPSSVRDFAEPEIARLIERTQQSPAAGASDKVKFLKLAWDAVGSEFGSRHTQYEMFYAGAGFVTKGNSFRTYDWSKATALVDRMMSSYALEDEVGPASAVRAAGAWSVRRGAAPAPRDGTEPQPAAPAETDSAR